MNKNYLTFTYAISGISIISGLLMACLLSFVLLLRSKPEVEEELHV